MNDDELIRSAVQKAENELTETLNDDEAYTEAIIESFRGRRRWFTLLLFAVALLWAGLMVGCGYQFFQADSTKSQIGWAAGFLAFLIAASQAEMWIGSEWQRYSLARELKRLELRVVELSERVGS